MSWRNPNLTRMFVLVTFVPIFPPNFYTQGKCYEALLFCIDLSVITLWLRDFHTPHTIPQTLFLTVW